MQQAHTETSAAITPAITPAAVAHAYLAVWNEADSDKRRKQLADGWTDDARYADPLMQASGAEAINAMIGAAQAQFAGHSFRLSGTPDGHGPFVRFSWTLEGAGGVVGGGTDVVLLDANGRVAQVTGFLDSVGA